MSNQEHRSHYSTTQGNRCIHIYIMNIFIFVNILWKRSLLNFSAMSSTLSGNAVNFFLSIQN